VLLLLFVEGESVAYCRVEKQLAQEEKYTDSPLSTWEGSNNRTAVAKQTQAGVD